MERIKVVWICSFSNPEIRSLLPKRKGLLGKFFKKQFSETDSAQWNTNGIREFEKLTDQVELHVVCPSRSINKRFYAFDHKGIHYHFFQEENAGLIRRFYRYLFTRYSSDFRINRKREMQLVRSINPDVVHLIGPECFHFSKVLMDIKDIPTIAQLQTVVHDPNIIALYPDRPDFINYRLKSEEEVLKSAQYIGAVDQHYKDIVTKYVKPDAVFLKLGLALGENVDLSYASKDYDFVYFASYIRKAMDLAIEAFALALKEEPNLTLDIVGGYSSEEKAVIDKRIQELGISDKITFEGRLPSHDDVIKQVKRSRFALLPLKVDTISGTVREAMAYGLPVVTCITPGTPSLNTKRESVLLSAVGDYKTMADNMVKLVRNPEFAEMIKNNAAITHSETLSNSQIMARWIEAYRAVVDKQRDGSQIPDDILL